MPVGLDNVYAPSTVDPFALSPVRTCIAELCTHNRPESFHFHHYIQIWYTRKGSYIHKIGDVTYEADHGSLAIIPPYLPHQIDTSHSHDTEIVCLSLLPSNIMRFWNVDGLPAILSGQSFGTYFLGEKVVNFTRFDGEFREYADYIFSDLYDCCQKHGDVPVNMCVKSLFGIFCAVPKNSGGEQLNKKKLSSLNEKLCIIEKAAMHICANFHEQITVNDMLSLTAFSKTAFSAAFREITGITFKEYLSLARICAAARELTITEQNLSEIAEKFSFSHKSHLIRQFKESLACSTSEYKVSSREWFKKYAPHWLPDELLEKSTNDFEN